MGDLNIDFSKKSLDSNLLRLQNFVATCCMQNLVVGKSGVNATSATKIYNQFCQPIQNFVSFGYS